jgi:hypothetical protein
MLGAGALGLGSALGETAAIEGASEGAGLGATSRPPMTEAATTPVAIASAAATRRPILRGGRAGRVADARRRTAPLTGMAATLLSNAASRPAAAPECWVASVCLMALA